MHVVAFEDGVEEHRAGVVVGEDASRFYIATSRRAVRHADSVRVEVDTSPGDWLIAVVDTVSTGLNVDLGVLHVDRPEAVALGLAPAFDRLGRSDNLRAGDRVQPVGCPAGACWAAPDPADRVLTAHGLEIAFQSFSVEGGSVGGALFNRRWEVVGMVSDGGSPRAGALPIDYVLAQLDRWSVPVSLERPSVPREGYETSVSFVALVLGTPTSVFRPDNSTVIPVGQGQLGGRLTASHRVRPPLSWHVGAMQLTPKNLLVTAGTAGLGLDLQSERLRLRPFAEVGFGQIESRADVGGYWIGEPAVYAPVWVTTVESSIGVGGGATLDLTVLPRTVIRLMWAHWAFSVPDEANNAPVLPDFFFGAGLRLGL